MKTSCLKVALFLFLFFPYSTTASAVLIDFEGLGLDVGSPVPSIGIASFIAKVAKQGGGAAFIAEVGYGTGDSGSFSIKGNTFIFTGREESNGSVKVVEISFLSPVTALQVDVCDIDSNGGSTIERLTATAYNSTNTFLGSIVHVAPIVPDYGDGDVVNINFGALSGITELIIKVDNVGSVPEATGYGWGLDNE